MEGLDSDLDLGSNTSHTKCRVNNDVLKVSVNKDNSVVNSVHNNHQLKPLNNGIHHHQNNQSIECIQLYDSEDSDHSHDSDVEPPNKMARLQGSDSALTSLPSPPHSPLHTTQPSISDYNYDNNSCESNQNKVQIKDSSSETKKSVNTLQNSCDGNERFESPVSNSSSNTCNTNIHSNDFNTNQTIQTNPNTNVSQTQTKNNNINQNLIENQQNIHIRHQNDSNETVIKRLIGLCLEKRLENQFKTCYSEQEFIEKMETLRSESFQRNEKLLKINESKAETDFSNKETQVNISLNKNAMKNSEENSFKVKTECIKVEKKSNVKSETSVEVSKDSILKEHLIGQTNDKNNIISNDKKSIIDNKSKNYLTSVLQSKNGLKNNFSQNIFILNNESKVKEPLDSTQTTSLANSSNQNNDNSDDDVVIIDSDEEEDTEETETTKPLKTTGLSMERSSLYNQCLPQPKLSVSVSKSNKPNYSVVNKGQNTSTEQVTLKWTIPKTHYKISKYLIYMTRNSSTHTTSPQIGPIGVVDALDPPMACTLSNLSHGNYRFYVRAKDSNSQIGPLSNIECVDIF